MLNAEIENLHPAAQVAAVVVGIPVVVALAAGVFLICLGFLVLVGVVFIAMLLCYAAWVVYDRMKKWWIGKWMK